jgi:hypothetical protein
MSIEKEIWETRWQALRRTIQVLIERLASSNTPDFYHKSTLLHALKGLQQFGQQSFELLMDGFYEKQTYKFLPITEPEAPGFAVQNMKGGEPKGRRYTLPKENILNYTLNQIGYDLEMLHYVIEQLGLELEALLQQSNPESDKSLQQFNETLRRADRLAWSALRPVLQPSSDMTVVTYFQRNMTVRILPYAPIALIGIPISCLTTPQDLLAIPHEVGHFIYWQTLVEERFNANHQQMRFVGPQLAPSPALTRHQLRSHINSVLKENVHNLPGDYQGWLEEVFADAYGCWIAGPLAGRTAQFLQMCRPEEEFLYNDGHYPTPVLRPLIYAALLGEFGHGEAAENLANLWKHHLQSTWKLSDEELTKAGVDLQKIPYLNKDLLEWVGYIKSFITDVLNPAKTPNWYEMVSDAKSVDEQLQKFVEYHSGAALDDEEWPSPPQLQLSEDVLNEILKAYLRVHNLSPEDDSISLSVNPKEINAEKWWPIVKWSGWAIEGPDGPKVHK